MQFIDLAAQQALIKEKIDQNIQNVLRHGNYIMGPEVDDLEGKLAEFIGVKHCISCSSGTDALLMALMAKDVGPEDVIFTTPFTFIATAEVIALLGATPVFVDIDMTTFNMDPDKLELAIKAVQSHDPSIYPLPSMFQYPTSDPRPLPSGIITVDLYGLPCDYNRIDAIAKAHDLFVIEDAAQAFGAEYHGTKACALAEIGCTSFYPPKPLGAYGDAGAIFTNDAALAEALISIRIHGMGSHKYDNIRIGINGRMDTLQAAILLPKFDIFPGEIQLRQEVANRYGSLLKTNHKLKTPTVPDGLLSVWAQYSVLAKNSKIRTTCMEVLQDSEIPTAIHYPKSLHMQNAFSYLGYQPDDFQVSKEVSSRIFSLPMHPYLKQEDQLKISKVLEGV